MELKMFKYSVKKGHYSTSRTEMSLLEMADIYNFLIWLKPQASL